MSCWAELKGGGQNVPKSKTLRGWPVGNHFLDPPKAISEVGIFKGLPERNGIGGGGKTYRGEGGVGNCFSWGSPREVLHPPFFCPPLWRSLVVVFANSTSVLPRITSSFHFCDRSHNSENMQRSLYPHWRGLAVDQEATTSSLCRIHKILGKEGEKSQDMREVLQIWEHQRSQSQIAAIFCRKRPVALRWARSRIAIPLQSLAVKKILFWCKSWAVKNF